MIYVLYGTDMLKAREKLRAFVDSLLSKKPDASLTFLDAENCNVEGLNDLIYGQGLFEKKRLIVLDRVLEREDVKEAVLPNLKEIADSDNIFIFLEEKVDAATLKKLEKRTQKIQAYEAKEKKKERFDIFLLTDAFGRRDKKRLWVLYQKARGSGVSSEKIHGILFWQVKSMLLAEESFNANDAGLNPFVFQKAKGFLKNYSPNELQKLSSELVDVYHKARRGVHELDIGLELFLLRKI